MRNYVFKLIEIKTCLTFITFSYYNWYNIENVRRHFSLAGENVTDVVFFMHIAMGRVYWLLTSVLSKTNFVLGFTTSDIKPKVEFRVSSEFLLNRK